MMQHRHRGFTWIELVTALFAVLFVLALMLPALVCARDSARVTKCKNNLKLLGLALHNYHDVHMGFAPGWVTREVDGLSTQGMGWTSSILPYIDQANVYNQLLPNGEGLDEIRDPLRQQALKTRIRLYRCPSDTTPEFNPFRGGWPTCNYSGNYGHVPFPRWLPAQASDYWPGQIKAVFPVRSRPVLPSMPTGLFAMNTCAQIRIIVDGASNTIMLGERGVTSGAGIWPGLTAAVHENDLLTDGSHASRPNNGLRSFSSQHMVVNTLFVDGSVQSLNPSVQSLPNPDGKSPLGVYQKLMSRNDGQIVEF